MQAPIRRTEDPLPYIFYKAAVWTAIDHAKGTCLWNDVAPPESMVSETDARILQNDLAAIRLVYNMHSRMKGDRPTHENPWYNTLWPAIRTDGGVIAVGEIGATTATASWIMEHAPEEWLQLLRSYPSNGHLQWVRFHDTWSEWLSDLGGHPDDIGHSSKALSLGELLRGIPRAAMTPEATPPRTPSPPPQRTPLPRTPLPRTPLPRTPPPRPHGPNRSRQMIADIANFVIAVTKPSADNPNGMSRAAADEMDALYWNQEHKVGHWIWAVFPTTGGNGVSPIKASPDTVADLLLYGDAADDGGLHDNLNRVVDLLTKRRLDGGGTPLPGDEYAIERKAAYTEQAELAKSWTPPADRGRIGYFVLDQSGKRRQPWFAYVLRCLTFYYWQEYLEACIDRGITVDMDNPPIDPWTGSTGVRHLQRRTLIDRHLTGDVRSFLHAAALDESAALRAHIGQAGVNAADRLAGGALHLAAYHGSVSCVKELLASDVDKDILDGAGQTALYVAIEMAQLAIAKLLVSSGASLDTVDAYMQNTPLHVLAAGNHMYHYPDAYNDVVVLMRHLGADPDKRNRHGQTPFQIAAYHATGHEDTGPWVEWSNYSSSDTPGKLYMLMDGLGDS